MAIRNIALGGASDFAYQEKPISSTDMNDTFDAAMTKIQSLSAFWLNSELYDVYDDFEGYSVGAFTDNSKWDITLTSGVNASGSASIASSTNAGGSGKELVLTGQSGSDSNTGAASAKTLTLTSNKHTFAKFKLTWSSTRYSNSCSWYIYFGNATDGWSTVYSAGASGGDVTDRAALQDDPANTVLVVAKGSNVYDVYYGGKKILSSVTKTNGAQLEFGVSRAGYGVSGTMYMYIDDVRQSKTTS